MSIKESEKRKDRKKKAKNSIYRACYINLFLHHSWHSSFVPDFLSKEDPLKIPGGGKGVVVILVCTVKFEDSYSCRHA